MWQLNEIIYLDANEDVPPEENDNTPLNGAGNPAAVAAANGAIEEDNNGVEQNLPSNPSSNGGGNERENYNEKLALLLAALGLAKPSASASNPYVPHRDGYYGPHSFGGGGYAGFGGYQPDYGYFNGGFFDY